MIGVPQRLALALTALVLFCTFAVHVPLERMTQTDIEHKAKIERSVRKVFAPDHNALEQSRYCHLACPMDSDTTVIEDGYVSVFHLTQPHGIRLQQFIIPLLD